MGDWICESESDGGCRDGDGDGNGAGGGEGKGKRCIMEGTERVVKHVYVGAAGSGLIDDEMDGRLRLQKRRDMKRKRLEFRNS